MKRLIIALLFATTPVMAQQTESYYGPHGAGMATHIDNMTFYRDALGSGHSTTIDGMTFYNGRVPVGGGGSSGGGKKKNSMTDPLD